jgi:hypothetical protein
MWMEMEMTVEKEERIESINRDSEEGADDDDDDDEEEEEKKKKGKGNLDDIVEKPREGPEH